MKLNNGYYYNEDTGHIYAPDGMCVGVILKVRPSQSDTLLDMFAMAALPSVAREWTQDLWPMQAYKVAAAMIQERANRGVPAAGEDGGLIDRGIAAYRAWEKENGPDYGVMPEDCVRELMIRIFK